MRTLADIDPASPTHQLQSPPTVPSSPSSHPPVSPGSPRDVNEFNEETFP